MRSAKSHRMGVKNIMIMLKNVHSILSQRDRMLVENDAFTTVGVPLGTQYYHYISCPYGTPNTGRIHFFYQHFVPNGTSSNNSSLN